jgi:hypothetical protein
MRQVDNLFNLAWVHSSFCHIDHVLEIKVSFNLLTLDLFIYSSFC